MKYTEQDLWGLVNRANTLEKVDIAQEWLIKHFKITDDKSSDLYHELIHSLTYLRLEFQHEGRYGN